MNYLMVIIPGGGSQYHPINHFQEQKIERLFEAKPRPKHFKLNGKEILTDTVLGFTEDKPKDKKNLGITDWNSFSSWVKQQDWYLKGSSRYSSSRS